MNQTPNITNIYKPIKNNNMNIIGEKTGQLAWEQIKKGLILFLVPLITIIIQWASNGEFPTDWETWKPVLLTCAVPVLYYILSLLQNSNGDLMKFEPKYDLPDWVKTSIAEYQKQNPTTQIYDLYARYVSEPAYKEIIDALAKKLNLF